MVNFGKRTHTQINKQTSDAAAVSSVRLDSASGPRRVCRNRAAFLLRSAWSCLSFDSLEAWASFSLAAAANRSSSFCLAGKERGKEKGREVRHTHIYLDTHHMLLKTKSMSKWACVPKRSEFLLLSKCKIFLDQITHHLPGFVNRRAS